MSKDGMKIKEIKDLREAVPFKRFSIELNSGRLVNVPTGDHLFIPPNHQFVIVANSHTFIIDLENISALILETAKKSDAQ